MKDKKLRLSIIISLALLMMILTAAGAAANTYRVGLNRCPERVPLATLRNGESAEIQFKLSNFDMSDKELNNVPRISLYLGNPLYCKSVYGNRLEINKTFSAWTLSYVPSGIDLYVRKFNKNVNINENGLNKLLFERNNNWLTVKLNGRLLAGLPFRDKTLPISMGVSRMEMDYRWIKRNFRERRDPYYKEITAGCFFTTKPQYRINDGESVRLYFNPIQRNRSRWINSIVIFVDKTALWMNEGEDRNYYANFNSDKKEWDRDEWLKLKDKNNYLEVSRKGNRLTFYLNGKKLGGYTHTPDNLLGEDWLVNFKFVAYHIRFRTEKTKVDNRVVSPSAPWPVKKEDVLTKNWKIADSIVPKEAKYIQTNEVLKDKGTIEIKFKLQKFYQAFRSNSNDIGFAIDGQRVFLRSYRGFYFIDPYNEANNVSDFANLPLVVVNDSINTMKFKRNGNIVNVFYNGKKIKSYDHSKVQTSPGWKLNIKSYSSRVKYKIFNSNKIKTVKTNNKSQT